MNSPPRSRKRGSEDQIVRQIDNFDPESSKRSKTSLECILEPFMGGNSTFTNTPPYLRALNNDGTLDGYEYVGGVPFQQSTKQSMMSTLSRQEGDVLSGTIVHEPTVRQHSQASVNGNAHQGPITNRHDTVTIPISTRQEDQRLAVADELESPVVRMNHHNLHNSVGGGEHGRQDYHVQLMLLEQENGRRLMKAKAEQEETALQKINSLPDHLYSAHTIVKDMLQNSSHYLQNVEDCKRSIPEDTKALQGHEKALDKMEAESKLWRTASTK